MSLVFSKLYLKILRDQYSGLNLTRIEDLEMFHVKQFRDSMAPLEQGERFKNSLRQKKLLVDVGFGGGLPILPLAKMSPKERFIGFEAKGKKVKAVRDIVQQLGLHNVFLYHHRIEEIEIDIPCLITFKAVGSIKTCLDWLYLTKACEVYFYKGPHLEEKEGEELGDQNWQLIEDLTFSLEGLSRRLVAFKNRHVPHGTMRKNLVKLSSLL